jgi:hypothetical protein
MASPPFPPFPMTRDSGRERPLKIRAAPTPMVSPPSPPSQDRAGSGIPRSGWRRLKIQPAAVAQDASGGLLLLHPAAWDPMLKMRHGRCVLKNRHCLQMRPSAATQDAVGGGSRSGRRRWLKMRPVDSFSRVRPPPPPPWRGGHLPQALWPPARMSGGGDCCVQAASGEDLRRRRDFFLFVGPAGQQHGVGGGPLFFYFHENDCRA